MLGRVLLVEGFAPFRSNARTLFESGLVDSPGRGGVLTKFRERAFSLGLQFFGKAFGTGEFVGPFLPFFLA